METNVGVIYDSRIAARVKWKVYKTVVRPAMMYDLETVTLTKRHEVEMTTLGVIKIESAERSAEGQLRLDRLETHLDGN